MTEWHYEDVAAQGKRADDAERALLAVIEMLAKNINPPCIPGMDLTVLRGSRAYVDAVEVLRASNLRIVDETLVRLGLKPSS